MEKHALVKHEEKVVPLTQKQLERIGFGTLNVETERVTTLAKATKGPAHVKPPEHKVSVTKDEDGVWKEKVDTYHDHVAISTMLGYAAFGIGVFLATPHALVITGILIACSLTLSAALTLAHLLRSGVHAVKGHNNRNKALIAQNR